MRGPYFITSHRLIDILELQYGLYHRVNRSHVWDLTDLLKESYNISILYQIYGPISDASLYATPYIPIVGAKVSHAITDNPALRIPKENFHDCISWYITDTAQWIIWVQSAQDMGKVWAWLIDTNGLGSITAFNDEIRKGGWYIKPGDTLRQHVAEWEAVCVHAHESWQRSKQHPITPDCSFELPPDAMPVMNATKRIPRFAAQWPVQDPDLAAMEDEIMKQIINSHRIDQTKL